MKKLIIPILILAILGLIFAWQFSQGLSARAQDGPGEFQQIEAEEKTIEEPAPIVLAMQDKLPAHSGYKVEQGKLFSGESYLDIPALLEGKTAELRADSEQASATDAQLVETSDLQGQMTATSPGDMVLFRQTFIPSESLGGMTYTIGSPSVANSGYIIFQTGQLYAAISANGGQDFKYIDPSTAFPASYGGFCCNQVAIYVPSRDMFIWELEYLPSGTQGGALRIAISRGADILKGAWYYYDLAASPGYSYNFSDLALSNDFLYITTTGLDASSSWTNSYVFRLPLDELLAGGGITYEFLVLHQFGLRGVQGATDAFYWAAHNSTSQVRVYKWEEVSPSAIYNDVNLSAAWYDNERMCPGPDGKNWCGGMGQAGRILTGWVGRETVGFMWGSSQGGSFAYPYIEALTVNASNLSYVGRPYIKSSSYAFIYPAATVNARGDVGVVFNYGGGALYPSVGYAVYDDFTTPPPNWTFYPAGASTNGPATNGYGRYNTVRPFAPTGLVWAASGYVLNGCGDTGCADPVFFIFGRGRDARSLTRYWGPLYQSFVPLLKK